MRPEDVIVALAEYVDLGGQPTVAPAAERPTGDIAMVRKGLTRAEAERPFGAPVNASQRQEGGLAVSTLVFNVGEQRGTAEFVDEVLVRYTIVSR